MYPSWSYKRDEMLTKSYKLESVQNFYDQIFDNPKFEITTKGRNWDKFFNYMIFDIFHCIKLNVVSIQMQNRTYFFNVFLTSLRSS